MVQVVVILAFVLSLLGAVDGEYACLCAYAVETPVYTDHRNDSSVLGYMYEFDCKPIAETSTESREFTAVQFEKSLGYVPFSETTKRQTCDGSVPLNDQIPQTTQPITETTYSTIWTSDWVTTPTELTTPPTEPDTPTTVPTTVPETTPPTTTTPTTTTPTTTTPTTTTPTTTTPTTTTPTTPPTTEVPRTEAFTEARTTPPSTTSVPVYTTVYETGLEWPSGTYGLMKAAQGCPDDSWKSGWRHQDTQDFASVNHFTESINLYLAGSFGDNIMTEFCIKDNAAGRGDWPKGSYCVLKKHDCPSGFSQGYIYWDDEDTWNGNDKGGTLPDGEFGKNTRIYYCCRDDADVNQEVALPTEHAFVLVRYSTECQRVRDMIVTDVHVRWDDEDDGWFSSAETDVGGMHPVDEDQNEGHLLHFCHYQLPQETFIG